jgi:hypothetical protein
MEDDAMEQEEGRGGSGAVLAATDRPVPLEVREIPDDRVPEGMRCVGTFLDGHLVARCAVPHGAMEFFDRHALFAEPRQLVLAAREESPGLRCELYAIVPLPTDAGLDRDEDEEEDAPWADSLPGAAYDREVSGEEDSGADPAMAAVLLGQIVRFDRDRKHPESLPLETMDVLARIVSGRVVEVVDRVLEDLLDPDSFDT